MDFHRASPRLSAGNAGEFIMGNARAATMGPPRTRAWCVNRGRRDRGRSASLPSCGNGGI
jgi:hypothetical protein